MYGVTEAEQDRRREEILHFLCRSSLIFRTVYRQNLSSTPHQRASKPSESLTLQPFRKRQWRFLPQAQMR